MNKTSTTTSTFRMPNLRLHTPAPPEIDPDTPPPTTDPDPSSPPDDVPPSDPAHVPEGDPPVKPPPVSAACCRTLRRL
ncbi:hypothetical protein [Paraburkholderia xenovorans]